MSYNLKKIYQKGHVTNAKISHDWSSFSVLENTTHLLRIAIPFDPAITKNSFFRTRSGIAVKKNTKNVMQDIEVVIRSAKHKFYLGKVWLEIFVERPNMAGDSINTMDIIADAVKRAIGIDDRYFALSGLDWKIVKENPRIFITIKQTISEDHEFCSACGQEQPLTEFTERVRERKLARQRTSQKFCASCRSASNVVKKKPESCMDCGKLFLRKNGNSRSPQNIPKTKKCLKCLSRMRRGRGDQSERGSS